MMMTMAGFRCHGMLLPEWGTGCTHIVCARWASEVEVII